MASKKTVVIKLKGGMGNQMFQYAFARSLQQSAKKHGEQLNLLFDTTAYTNPEMKDTLRPYSLPCFNTHAAVANDDVSRKAREPYGVVSRVLRKVAHAFKLGNEIAFVPSLLLPPYKKYYEGYWQSPKYFVDIETELRQEFILREPLGNAAEEMSLQINNDPHAVSIFYRRTDYVGHPDFDIGEQEYQRRAIARMSELVPVFKLYVMSDDIEWAKKNASLPLNSVFVSSKEIPPHEEMYLASICKYHIIPNSTFAWWGAWLDSNPNKIVIAPKNWVRGDQSEYKDIVPASWQRV